MKAVILAGGKGIRLGSLARDIPKPMIKIGGISILEHQIRLFKRYGLTNIIILTGHLGEVIEDYFGDGADLGVNIVYYREKQPLGTTGGLKEIEELLNEEFTVLYGDIMLDMDVRALWDFHREKKGCATLVVHPNDHPYDSDLVEIDGENRIVELHSKPHDENTWYRNMVNAAVYVFSPRILRYIQKGVKADFGKDIFPQIVSKEILYGYNTAEYIRDVGTPARWEQANDDYNKGKIARFNRANPRKAVFLDRDGTICKKIDQLHKVEDLTILPRAIEAIKRLNASDFLTIVVTNQPAVARNLCSIETVNKIHKKMETILGKERAKLDAIYFCPHHPDKGYPEENKQYKIDCNCRKPKTGMIEKAKMDFNIDLNGSFIIGDSFRDVLCGKNIGLTTTGVRTGDGCNDGSVQPDYKFDDILDAVKFVLQKTVS